MKTIKQTLLFCLIILGIEAYSQEKETSVKEKIEFSELTKNTDSLDLKKTEKSIDPPTLNIHDLKLNEAHFQNKGIRQISQNSRWEDSFLQSDNNSRKMGDSNQIASDSNQTNTSEKQSLVRRENNLIAKDGI